MAFFTVLNCRNQQRHGWLIAYRDGLPTHRMPLTLAGGYACECCRLRTCAVTRENFAQSLVVSCWRPSVFVILASSHSCWNWHMTHLIESDWWVCDCIMSVCSVAKQAMLWLCWTWVICGVMLTCSEKLTHNQTSLPLPLLLWLLGPPFQLFSF